MHLVLIVKDKGRSTEIIIKNTKSPATFINNGCQTRIAAISSPRIDP